MFKLFFSPDVGFITGRVSGIVNILKMPQLVIREDLFTQVRLFGAEEMLQEMLSYVYAPVVVSGMYYVGMVEIFLPPEGYGIRSYSEPDIGQVAGARFRRGLEPVVAQPFDEVILLLPCKKRVDRHGVSTVLLLARNPDAVPRNRLHAPGTERVPVVLDLHHTVPSQKVPGYAVRIARVLTFYIARGRPERPRFYYSELRVPPVRKSRNSFDNGLRRS